MTMKSRTPPIVTRMSSGFVDMILALENEKFLCGPDGDPKSVVIDDVFGRDDGLPDGYFARSIQDFCVEAQIERDRVSSLIQVTTPLYDYVARFVGNQPPILELDRGYMKIVPATLPDSVSIGVMAVSQGPMAPGLNTWSGLEGLSIGASLSVTKNMRYFGIGRALVVARLLSDEQLPTWEHDKPGYSYAGAAVVKNAIYDLKLLASHALKGGDPDHITTKALARYNVDPKVEEPDTPCP